MKIVTTVEIYFNPQSLEDTRDAIKKANELYESDFISLVPKSDLIDCEVYCELEENNYCLFGNKTKGYRFKK